MAEPVKGKEWTFPVTLDSVLGPGFQVNPTIVPGDFKISLDGLSFVNLASLPQVSPPGSAQVMVSLNGAERDADVALLVAKDQSGDEWEEMAVTMDIPVSTPETAVDILKGDRIESSVNYKIFKKGTTEVLVEKDITGSLLRSDITLTTLEP